MPIFTSKTTETIRTSSNITETIRESLGDDDASQFSGYVEVRAVEGPGGLLKDEIMIVVPLPEKTEKELDEDPLYYYPPSTSKQQYPNDDEDTCSESDSDEDDDFDVDHNSSRAIVQKTQQEKQIETAEEHSFMEELLQTLDSIFGCSYGGCTEAISTPALKSALRRKGTPNYHAPVNRNVSFTKLEIREFNMTLGNHPSAVTVSVECFCIDLVHVDPLADHFVVLLLFRLVGPTSDAGLGFSTHQGGRDRFGKV
jgi:hypothetical protein